MQRSRPGQPPDKPTVTMPIRHTEKSTKTEADRSREGPADAEWDRRTSHGCASQALGIRASEIFFFSHQPAFMCTMESRLF